MKYNDNYWNDVESILEYIPNVNNVCNKSFLITGATGMVCSCVIDVLTWLNFRHGARIHLILAGRNKERIDNRFKSNLGDFDYEFVEYDATQHQTLQCKSDYIIHGAGNANPAIYAKEPVETLVGSIIGSQSVLEVARENKARFLYVSSSEVYGNRYIENAQYYSEGDYGYVDILNPRACYPNGKRAVETLCSCYGMEYNVDTVVVRLGHIYGPTITPADTRASAAFTREVAEGNNIIMKSAGTQIRSYCYVLDCASAILTVLLNGKRGNAYNISNKNSIVSIRDFAEMIAKIGGVKITYENPSDIELHSYNLMNNSALNSEQLESLGWKGIFDLNEGIQKTLEFY